MLEPRSHYCHPPIVKDGEGSECTVGRTVWKQTLPRLLVEIRNPRTKAMPITVISGRAFVPETLLLGAHLKAVIAPAYDDSGSRVCTAALFAATQDGKPHKGLL